MRFGLRLFLFELKDFEIIENLLKRVTIRWICMPKTFLNI
jgi:hypothetical protein